MVRPGEGTEDTRRLATQAEVGDKNWDLVTYLASYKARLVVTGWNKVTNENTVEVVHEALIREWKDLQAWVSADRHFRTWQESLRASISTWEKSNRDREVLLRGNLLVEAKGWLEKRSSAITLPEKRFIQKSKQRERLNQYGLTTLGIIFATLSIFALQQFSERQFQDKLMSVLIGGSAKPELLPILPKALEIANRQVYSNHIDEGIESYKAVITATQNFVNAALKETEKFQEKDIKQVLEIQDNAENFLSKIIRDKYFSQLQKQLDNHQFGSLRKNVKVTDFEDQYTDGALKTTYRILMRKPGLEADLNKNGFLDSTEKIYLPCKTLQEIELLWRRATGWRCGFYDQHNKDKSGEKYYIAQNCRELSHMTLTDQIFPRPIDDAIGRLKNCKIEEVTNETH
ncbi:MAG: hypothetical protein IGS48_15695 [Oscillatoriales cyanobacterium C42_A2020_001]|nr:hypothetical protein [Leptolyngbyaceae cyanobacterium C42_A2020_001]